MQLGRPPNHHPQTQGCWLLCAPSAALGQQIFIEMGVPGERSGIHLCSWGAAVRCGRRRLPSQWVKLKLQIKCSEERELLLATIEGGERVRRSGQGALRARNTSPRPEKEGRVRWKVGGGAFQAKSLECVKVLKQEGGGQASGLRESRCG